MTYRVLQGRLEVVDSRNQVVLDVMGQGQVVLVWATEELVFGGRARARTRGKFLVWRGVDLHHAMESIRLRGGYAGVFGESACAERLQHNRVRRHTLQHGFRGIFEYFLDDAGRGARQLADEFKRSLFEAEDRLKVELTLAVEAVAGAMSDFVAKGHRLCGLVP